MIKLDLSKERKTGEETKRETVKRINVCEGKKDVTLEKKCTYIII